MCVSERRQLDIPSDSNELFKTSGLSGRSGEGNKCPCVFENESVSGLLSHHHLFMSAEGQLC